MITSKRLLVLCFITVIHCVLFTVWGQEDLEDAFGQPSLEALLTLDVTDVTTVTGVEEPLRAAPAAIYVITAEDIKQRGIRSIPEALRSVPGLHVGQISSNVWSVSSRGFGRRFTNKLLVLLDGRSIYTPAFGGVNWDSYDLILEDIDRIEVIRGPGAVLWGANAFNGVINIITKNAYDSLGLHVEGAYGTHERGAGSIRYGGEIGAFIAYRIWGKYFNRAPFDDRDALGIRTGVDVDDNWDMTHGGFRLDWEPDDRNLLTAIGMAYDSDNIGLPTNVSSSQPPPFGSTLLTHDDRVIDGQSLTLKWNQDNGDNGFQLQAYYDRYNREDVTLEGETVHTYDIDFREYFTLGDRHSLIYGLGFRYVDDDFEKAFTVSYNPDERITRTFSGFLQDTIDLIEDKWLVTIGSKIEENDFTGLEVQPSIRTSFKINEWSDAWGSVSRAVRVPNRTSDDIFVRANVFPEFTIAGDRSAKSEELLAYELGLRVSPVETLSFDLAAYYNDYDRLETSTPPPGSPPPPAPTNNVTQNEQDGEGYGLEIAAEWQITERWRLKSAYTFFKLALHGPRSLDETAENTMPENQVNLQSSFQLNDYLEFNVAGYYVDNVAVDDPFGSGDIPAYIRLDVGITWRPNENLEIVAWGQNLTDSKHREFFALQTPTQIEVERSAYVGITFNY